MKKIILCISFLMLTANAYTKPILHLSYDLSWNEMLPVMQLQNAFEIDMSMQYMFTIYSLVQLSIRNTEIYTEHDTFLNRQTKKIAASLFVSGRTILIAAAIYSTPIVYKNIITGCLKRIQVQ